MPGLTYRGFAAKFADKRFARKVFAFNLFLFCLLSIYMIWSNRIPDEKIDTCDTAQIEWTEFIQHTCEKENLWVLIDGHVYDMWPWGKN